MTAQGVDAGRAPRSVRVIYIARALSFACAFGVLTLLAWQRGMGSSIWLGLALQFLVYPHVLYALSCRAGDPKRAELNHLWLDSLLLGAWLAVFGFSEWIAFGLMLATTQNSIVFRGLAACAGSLLLFAAGALSAGATAGFPYEPEVGRAVFILCMACISTRPPCVSAGTVMPFSPPGPPPSRRSSAGSRRPWHAIWTPPVCQGRFWCVGTDRLQFYIRPVVQADACWP